MSDNKHIPKYNLLIVDMQFFEYCIKLINFAKKNKSNGKNAKIRYNPNNNGFLIF